MRFRHKSSIAFLRGHKFLIERTLSPFSLSLRPVPTRFNELRVWPRLPDRISPRTMIGNPTEFLLSKLLKHELFRRTIDDTIVSNTCLSLLLFSFFFDKHKGSIRIANRSASKKNNERWPENKAGSGKRKMELYNEYVSYFPRTTFLSQLNPNKCRRIIKLSNKNAFSALLNR